MAPKRGASSRTSNRSMVESDLSDEGASVSAKKTPRRGSNRKKAVISEDEEHLEFTISEESDYETVEPKRGRKGSKRSAKDRTSSEDISPDPNTKPRGRGRLSTISDDYSDLTDAQCAQKMRAFESNKDFLKVFSKKVDQDKIVRGALKANGGNLKCYECENKYQTVISFMYHIKKCGSATVVAQRGPTRAYKKKFDSSELTIKELKKSPHFWLQMTTGERGHLIDRELDNDFQCFNCSASFQNKKELMSHMNSGCIKSEYYSYKGRVADLRKLEKKDLSRMLRESLAVNSQLPCLVCEKKFAHVYGIHYHIIRCGLDPEERPWSCYRCQYETTQALSVMHDCRFSDVSAFNDMTASIKSEKEPHRLMCKMSDVVLRTGKTLNKPDDFPSATVDIVEKEASVALEELLGTPLRMDSMGRIGRRSRQGPSVASGFIPSTSSRISAAKGGGLRFKFRKLEVMDTISNPADHGRYKKSLELAEKAWLDEAKSDPFCSRLDELPVVNWKDHMYKEVSPAVCAMLSKSSVGFVKGEDPPSLDIMHSSSKEKGKPPVTKYSKNSSRRPRIHYTSMPSELSHLSFGEGTSLESQGDWTNMAYAGGAVNNIEFSPNQLDDGSDVFAVSTFPDEDTLIGPGRSWTRTDSFVQLWRVHREQGKTPTPKLWCLLRVEGGAVLKLTWCSKPNTDDLKVIGFLAVSTGSGKVVIYRIDQSSIPPRKDSAPVPVYTPPPSILLEQDEDKEITRHSEDDTVKIGCPPVVSIDWGFFNGGNKIAGCNAAGHVLIWELDNAECSLPIEMSSEVWQSPAQDVVWNSSTQLAVSFRERLLRVLDIETGECILEEGTVRTAGARIAAQLRVFPGIFLYQSEYFSSPGENSFTGLTYLVMDGNKSGYFVVPLGNRHELQTWEVTACSRNGIVVSSGVDGSLFLSTNGRLAPIGGKTDYSFSTLKKALQLTSFRLEKPAAVEGHAPPMYFTHSKAVDNMWLEINVHDCERVPMSYIPHSTGDLRLQSLNVCAISMGNDPVIISGGQAGLLFCVNCDI